MSTAGQQVEVRAAAGQSPSGLYSTCGFSGDFDVEVDYALISWPSGHSYGLRLAINGGAFGIYRTGGGNYAVYNGSTLVAQVQSNDTRGRFRIVRDGSIVSGYYGAANDWIRLGSAPHDGSVTRLALDLSAQTPVTSREIVATFDGFRINHGTPAD